MYELLINESNGIVKELMKHQEFHYTNIKWLYMLYDHNENDQNLSSYLWTQSYFGDEVIGCSLNVCTWHILIWKKTCWSVHQLEWNPFGMQNLPITLWTLGYSESYRLITSWALGYSKSSRLITSWALGYRGFDDITLQYGYQHFWMINYYRQ